MVKIIFKLWPALTPILIYLLWLMIASRKKDIKVKDEFLEKKQKYRFYALSSCGFIAIFMMIIYGAIAEPTPEKLKPEPKYIHQQ